MITSLGLSVFSYKIGEIIVVLISEVAGKIEIIMLGTVSVTDEGVKRPTPWLPRKQNTGVSKL